MYKFIRSILFLMSAESAHTFGTWFIKILMWIPGIHVLITRHFKVNGQLGKELMGLHFPNPVGLAAGFDKNASMIHEFKSFGFGFIEIGTITPKAQPGNERPRLFRLIQDRAIINRMGFNNLGLEKAIEKLKRRPDHLIIGGNIGKNKVTPNEEATRDYELSFEGLFNYVDYFVVNVSSPNTPNLRELQDKEPLTKLLKSLMERNSQKTIPKPILLKIAPDLGDEQLDDILDIIQETKIEGIIATNTTISREGLLTDQESILQMGNGGLSGAPLTKRSTEIIRYLRSRNQDMVIIGVGGIMNEDTALEKLEAGADLIQLYTGFVYEGPSLIKRINKAILRNIEEA